jgi:hypothetical protein
MDRKTKLNIIIVFIIIIISSRIYKNTENFTNLENINYLSGESGNRGIIGPKGPKGEPGDMGEYADITDNNFKINTSLILGKNGKIYNNKRIDYQLKLSKNIKRGGTKLKIDKDGISDSIIHNYISLDDELKINKKGIYLKGNFKTTGGYIKMKLNNELKLFDRVPKNTIWPWHFENGDNRILSSGFYHIKSGSNFLGITGSGNQLSLQNSSNNNDYFYIRNNNDRTYTILVLKFYSTPSCSNTDFNPNSSNCANDSRYMKFMGIHPSNNTVLMSPDNPNRFNFLLSGTASSNQPRQFKISNLNGNIPKYLKIIDSSNIAAEVRHNHYFDGQMIIGNQFGNLNAAMNACNNHSDCSGVATFPNNKNFMGTDGVTRTANANTFNLFTGNMVPAPSTHSGGRAWSISQAIYEDSFSNGSVFTFEPRIPPGWTEYTLGDKIILGNSIDFPLNSSSANRSEQLVLNENNLPSHNHTASSTGNHIHPNTSTQNNNGHNHSFTLTDMPNPNAIANIDLREGTISNGSLPITTTASNTTSTSAPNIANYNSNDTSNMNLINSQNHTHSVTNVSVPQISSEARHGYYFDGQMIIGNQFGNLNAAMNACNNHSDCSGVATFPNNKNFMGTNGVTRTANAHTFNLFTGNMVPAPSTHLGARAYPCEINSGNHNHTINQTIFENCRHEHNPNAPINTCVNNATSSPVGTTTTTPNSTTHSINNGITPINFQPPFTRLKYIKKL